MARVLCLSDDSPRVWDLLGEYVHCYGDNGGDPDGNCWLPAEGIPDELAQRVVAAGWGRMEDVLYADDDAILVLLGFAPRAEGEGLDEDTVDRMKEAMDDVTYGWAHYGAYGAGDSAWVYIPTPDIAAQDTPWERLMYDISHGRQDINLTDFERRMGLESGAWDWEDFGPDDYGRVLDAITAGLR